MRSRTTALLLVALVSVGVSALTAQVGSGAAARDATGLARCDGMRAEPRLACYTSTLERSVRARGVTGAMQEVDAHRRTSRTFAHECHLALHPVGSAAGRRLARAGAGLPDPTPDSFCHEGYVHGLTIAWLATADVDRLPADSQRVCATPTVPAAWSCAHSLGHVFVERGDGSMPTAGRSCERAGRAHPWRLPVTRRTFVASCVKGGLMEQQLQAARDGTSFERGGACTGVTGGAALPCYAFLAIGLTEDGAATCEAHAPRGAYRDACVAVWARGLDDPALCASAAGRARAVCEREVRVRGAYAAISG